jgi:hypothetical protein
MLDLSAVDSPIVDIVRDFARTPYCFTLQSCFGHFVYDSQPNPYSVEPLPITDGITRVEYRIAYLALCIENSGPGRALFDALAKVPAVDPDYIQFGCADWFWERQVNSYALQVEPERHKTQDRIDIDYLEALHIQNTRDRFFAQIRKLLDERLACSGGTQSSGQGD